jgi:oligosaccharide translocation protein RFT1
VNIFIARLATKEIYGYANVTLQFYYSLILFFMKECVRKAVQKEVDLQGINSIQKVRSALNLVLVTMLANFLTTFLVIYGVTTWYEVPGVSENTLFWTVFWYMGAAIFETLCESFVVLLLDKVEYEAKVFVEGTSLFLRGVILLIFLYFEFGVLAFGLAHFWYGFIMLLLYFYKAYNLDLNKDKHSLYSIQKVKLEKDRVYFIDEHKTQLAQISLIGAFRFLLAEGENLVLNFTTNLSMVQQGEYSLISNLCSIICRFIFQPLEELSYNIFGKESLKQTHIQYMSRMLRNLFFLGIVIISFSQNYAYAALYVLYRERWTNESTVSILQAYGVYIFTMGVNGVTEAFVMAKSNKDQLKKMQLTMTISSIIFILSMFMFVKIGPTGIVYANILNMISRILTNSTIIYTIIGDKGNFTELISNSLPNWKVWAAVILTYPIWYYGKIKYEQSNLLIHLSIGATTAAVVFGAGLLWWIRV